MEFIYWRHPTLPGIKVEEVTGGGRYSGKVWFEMARQVYCENGREEYREIGHYKSGAPFLYGYAGRISVTHCAGMFAVATLPATPEVNLCEFSERAALGIDAERADRSQVLKIRERFLSDNELNVISADDVQENVLAWTVKEAAYKAMLTHRLDFRENIQIKKMPELGPASIIPGRDLSVSEYMGLAIIIKEGELEIPLNIYSFVSEDHIVTLAFSPRCAKFGK